ncbi:MAG: glycoside hydrolase family 3 N-terminal domain-containing protein [Bacteroidota bacterium]|nr:glycoside hydrolase family 3 N-terminal domain-containing protein [Bacteroidota bacterium]
MRLIVSLVLILGGIFGWTSINNIDKFEQNDAVLSDTSIVANNTFSEKFDFYEKNQWVDSVYKEMTLDEKIGQLFMVAAYSNKDEKHAEAMDYLIEKFKIGGLIFFQGGPVRQAKLTNRFQAKSKIPLFIGIDAEWGLSMRLDSTFAFPYNMTLGAVQDLQLIEKMGQNMGRQCNRMGIHFNFSPVVDVNTNPQNPIIGSRSFGEDPKKVAERAVALMKGIQSANVLATAKHFPGHGDTDKDSHHTLPTVNHSMDRIKKVELYPYQELIQEGLASVMVAHLNIPELEQNSGVPSSISNPIVTDLLQKELGFKGLVFTDALNMKGVSNFKKPGELEVAALLAGNDVLLFSENVPLAVQKIKEAFNNGTLKEEQLETSVKKILYYKHKAKLDKYKPIETDNLVADLNNDDDRALYYQLMKQAMTVLKNDDNVLPIKDLDKHKIAYIKVGDDSNTSFVETINKFTDIEVFNANVSNLLKKIQNFDLIIIGNHKSDVNPWKSHTLTAKELQIIDELVNKKQVIFVAFTRPYALSKITNLHKSKAVVLAYQNSNVAQEIAAQVIFGSTGAKGKLPVFVNAYFPINCGVELAQIGRLGFDLPENVGMDSKILNNIDSIAQDAIAQKIAPGMQVLVARKGKVVYHKSFGYHTYENQLKVKNSDLYDVASLTKIAATLPLIIQKVDQGNINITTKLSELLPYFSDTDKKDISLQELLTHNSGFIAWKPFYKATLDSASKKPSSVFYSTVYSEEFPDKVADNMYIKKGYTDVILKEIAESKLNKKGYKYSDFSFILLKEYLEKNTGKKLDELVDEHFYKSLGMNRTTYNPLKKYSLEELVPTEQDTYFRYQRIHGYVHDMAAAMQGGVAGQAGLFSNSLDIAKMMQLYLQKGTYAQKQYFSSDTFDVFNKLYYNRRDNRRGLGFDKPTGDTKGNTCTCVSMDSFGHTGFTGTMSWADPHTETIFVFLSNRTFPDSNAPNRLSRENIRSRIQEVISQSISQL